MAYPRGEKIAYGGYAQFVEPPVEYITTSRQICGIYPYNSGASLPVKGVPLGREYYSGAAFCCDPISWFQEAKLIQNPSAFILGLPGFGKSTLVRKLLLGSAGFGRIPLVLGDLKPDHVDLIQAMGGQTITLGHNRGSLNPLDFSFDITKVSQKPKNEIISDFKARRLDFILMLLTVFRQNKPITREEAILTAALNELDKKFPLEKINSKTSPILNDLLQIIINAPESVQIAANSRGNENKYLDITENLEADIRAIATGTSRLGNTFSKKTTNIMKMDRPVVFDLSNINESEAQLRAASLLASWQVGFGTVEVANILAEANVIPQRHYDVVMDELWMVLRAGNGIVTFIDGITRLNRNYGVSQTMITHTMEDLLSMPDEHDKQAAKGLVARAGIKFLGPLPNSEMTLLNSAALELSKTEAQLLQSWVTPASWRGEQSLPGQGCFLCKIGGRPGIAFRTILTPSEMSGIHDTNKKWHAKSKIGGLND
ncbi:MAG: hypothetical protein LBT99_03260 [Bifidobacteriaceae bacterium]|jgi:hypothetical protein|nr:hypothetical protein [Bifidobacteriaceae bacterium]